ncbi:hypothetical protein [Streptomyces sp. NPDC058545]|uniref:hypothetical protein n=1 Tax=Streptomyces sp. NPDC058545 TaxID=3346544 RepID=UPI0036629FBB
MKRKTSITAAAMAAALAAVIGPVAPAQAGGSCTGGCSETINESHVGAIAFRNWCRSGDLTGAETSTQPTCTVEGVPQSTKLLAAWTGRTPVGEDWDGFRVDAGWCYRVFFHSYIWGDWWHNYNQSNKTTHSWVKVSNDATAYINQQKQGSCPAS